MSVNETRIERIVEMYESSPVKMKQEIQVKCPDCGTNLKLAVGAGGGPGGADFAAIIECPNCKKIFGALNTGISF